MRPPSTTPIAAQTRKSSMSSGFIGVAPSGQSRGIGDQPLGVPPGEQDADDIADAVPVDGQRPDLDDHRIDVREGQGPPAAAADSRSSKVSGRSDAARTMRQGLAGSRRRHGRRAERRLRLAFRPSSPTTSIETPARFCHDDRTEPHSRRIRQADDRRRRRRAGRAPRGGDGLQGAGREGCSTRWTWCSARSSRRCARWP